MKIYKFLAMLLLVAGIGLSFVSCSDDDDEDTNSVTIINNSTYSFNRFTIYFMNARYSDNGEVISRQDFGTLNPNGSVSAVIPAGANYYWLGMSYGGETYVSADFNVSVTKLNIDNNFNWEN